MSVAHERAARARDNPHGFDLTRTPAVGAAALPNLEAADDEIGRERTVGFGPIAPAAGSRRGLLRPDGWAWVEGGGRGPAPGGFDFAFYNAAPRDQQIDALRSGDVLVLENLNREHPRLETRLPGVRPKAFLVPADVDRGIEVSLRCDTLWVDTDRALLTLSWRGLVTVDTPDEETLGTVVVAAESKGRELGYAHIAKILREGVTSSTDGDTLTEARPLRPPSLAEIDPDLLPTPGAFRPKRALPAVGAQGSQGPAAKVPATVPTPIVIEAEESGTPLAWEEISSTDSGADRGPRAQDADPHGTRAQDPPGDPGRRRGPRAAGDGGRRLRAHRGGGGARGRGAGPVPVRPRAPAFAGGAARLFGAERLGRGLRARARRGGGGGAAAVAAQKRPPPGEDGL